MTYNDHWRRSAFCFLLEQSGIISNVVCLLCMDIIIIVVVYTKPSLSGYYNNRAHCDHISSKAWSQTPTQNRESSLHGQRRSDQTKATQPLIQPVSGLYTLEFTVFPNVVSLPVKSPCNPLCIKEPQIIVSMSSVGTVSAVHVCISTAAIATTRSVTGD